MEQELEVWSAEKEGDLMGNHRGASKRFQASSKRNLITFLKIF
jgi:hypothetical protein